MKLSDLLLNRFLYKDALQNLETKDSSYNAGNVVEETPPPLASGGAAQDINTSNVTINGQQLTPGTYPVTVLDVSNWGWGQTCAFSSTDLNTVSWGAGVFTSASGVSYAISAGNTGNMAAKTYIYLDLLVSETAYQITTTPATAVGVGKVLVAVANPDTASATYNLSEATQIVGDNILANSINASKITTGQLIVGTNVGLGTAQDAGGVTTIIGNTVTTGFVNALSVVAGSVAAENITGTTITGKTIRTSSGNDRIEMKNDNTLTFYSGGYSRTFITNGILGFNTPLGIGSGSIYGYGTEEMVIDTGNSPYHFNASSFFPDSFVADLGTSTDKWRDGWFSRDVNVGDDLFVTDDLDVGGTSQFDGTVNTSGDFSVLATPGLTDSYWFTGGDGVTTFVLEFWGGILVDYTEI